MKGDKKKSMCPARFSSSCHSGVCVSIKCTCFMFLSPSRVRVSVEGACLCQGDVFHRVRVSIGGVCLHQAYVSPSGVHVSVGAACFRQAYLSPPVCVAGALRGVAGAPRGVAAVVRV